MFKFQDKLLSKRQPSPTSDWHDERRHLDTVVFVHGILGSHSTTWGEFLNLVNTDPDLPVLDILNWGYNSGMLPGSYQDVQTEGDSLIGNLKANIREDNLIFLVGHSMGGLVILSGLTTWIRKEHAHRHPVNNVDRIVLYATPLNGSEVANVVVAALSLHWVLRLLLKLLPGQQLKNLQQGKFCTNLLGETNALIYQPQPGSLLTKRAIPVTACAGIHDALVSVESATTIFYNPPSIKLNADHGSIKLPADHGDFRYTPLKNELLAGLAPRFHKLCVTVTQSSLESERWAAAERLDLQYGAIIRRCAALCVAPRNVTDDDLREVAIKFWLAGAKAVISPAQISAEVYREYRYGTDPRLKRSLVP
jgi:pimeloyl-ACP methyl ester carboxylesterase